jgi:hypothetical protein
LLRHLILDRNRACILAFELLWGLAMPFVYYSTVLPGYLQHLHVPSAWIGLAPALHTGMLALVQPLSAYGFRRGEGRVSRMLRIYASGALGYAVLGAVVLAGFGSAAAAMAGVAVFALATGIGDPHYMETVVEAVSPELRGRFFGLRNVFLGIGGIVGGVLAGMLLKSAPAPDNFGRAFLTGGLLYMASTLSMAWYRQPPAIQEERSRGFGSFLSERVAGHLRRPGFAPYLLATVFFSLAVCAFPFLGLLVKERLHETDRILGFLGAILMGCNLTVSVVLGVVCDRWGSRLGFILALLAYVGGVLGCLAFHQPLPLLLSYGLACSWMPGQFVAGTDLALRLAREAPASEVTALMMAAMAPARILGPIALGAALDRWGHGAALSAAADFGMLAVLALTLERGRESTDRPTG